MGALRTNGVETIWRNSLKFRNKDGNIGGDRGVMLSNLATAHFNQIHIMQWDPGYCAQARLCELLGFQAPQHSLEAWRKANSQRMESSIRRHTEQHKIKVAKQKKRRRARKEDDARKAKASKDSYQSGLHFGESKVAAERASSKSSSDGGSGTTRKCKKCNKDDMYHEHRARMCRECKAQTNKKKKQPAKASNKKGKNKRARVESEIESESESESSQDRPRKIFPIIDICATPICRSEYLATSICICNCLRSTCMACRCT